MFHKKIDKMQAEIDQLLGLCSEANGDVPGENEQLGVLILRAHDGDLDKADFQQLQQRIVEDDTSLRYYVDFQLLSAMLEEVYGSPRLNRVLDVIADHHPIG